MNEFQLLIFIIVTVSFLLIRNRVRYQSLKEAYDRLDGEFDDVLCECRHYKKENLDLKKERDRLEAKNKELISNSSDIIFAVKARIAELRKKLDNLEAELE